jgi:hypothetical protein
MSAGAMKLSHWLGWLCVALPTAVLFVGCGGDSEDQSEPKNEAGSSSQSGGSGGSGGGTTGGSVGSTSGGSVGSTSGGSSALASGGSSGETTGGGGAGAAAGSSGSSGEGGTGGGGVQCLLQGGVCYTIAVVANACASCPQDMSTAFAPAPPEAGALGCTVEGDGSGPLCCLPIWTPQGDCRRSGGQCYPPVSGDNACPTGWDAVYTACPEAEDTCCIPGPGCP